MNISKKSKPFIVSILLIAVVVLPLTIYLLQKAQVFENFAWDTEQIASSACSPTGDVVISASFSNTESTQSMNVTANDLQTGIFTNLGTIKAGAEKSAQIDTNKTSLKSGTVVFNLTWTDGSSGTDSKAATYEAVSTCPAPTPTPPPPNNYCPASGQNNQGLCEWDSLSGAQGYNVVVTETDNGNTVQSVSVPSTATESAFPMTPGLPYQCTVTPTDECGNGGSATSPTLTCPVTTTPTPPTSPTPTVEISPTPTPVISISPSPTTPPISPTSTPIPSPTPAPISPTSTPFPTPTPAPISPTSTPFPTPTPVVIVTVLTSPPQQTVQTVPGQTQTIVQPGQTQTIVEQPRVVTPGPTMPPTGNTTPTFVLIGTSALLLLAGGLIFFII